MKHIIEITPNWEMILLASILVVVELTLARTIRVLESCEVRQSGRGRPGLAHVCDGHEVLLCFGCGNDGQADGQVQCGSRCGSSQQQTHRHTTTQRSPTPSVRTRAPVGRWAAWGVWTSCQGRCGAESTRVRQCQYGECFGSDVEYRRCDPCEQDQQRNVDQQQRVGTWAEWGPWGTCSQTCNGYISRSRQCEGGNCEGEATHRAPCYYENDAGCTRVDGQWGEWGSWGRCINGERRIERKCDNPEPANHGASCVGYAEAHQRC